MVDHCRWKSGFSKNSTCIKNGPTNTRHNVPETLCVTYLWHIDMRLWHVCDAHTHVHVSICRMHNVERSTLIMCNVEHIMNVRITYVRININEYTLTHVCTCDCCGIAFNMRDDAYIVNDAYTIHASCKRTFARTLRMYASWQQHVMNNSHVSMHDMIALRACHRTCSYTMTQSCTCATMHMMRTSHTRNT